LNDQDKTDEPDLTVDKLWELASRQDQHLLDEFGIAIVGIGALFFAYGSIHTTSVKLIVALIGLGASLILWNDMNASKKEYDAILRLIAKRNTPFVKALKEIWSSSGFLTKRFEEPTARIMSYFMLLVAWAWAVIIIYRVTYIGIHGPGVQYGIPEWVLDRVLSILFVISGVIPLELWRRLRSGKIKDKRLVS